ncbi:MAG: autotransporter domain-containing protein [Pseudomonadota bacterium]
MQRRVFRRAPLALAMSAAIAMLSSGALAVTPSIDQDNANILISANETGDIVTLGGPWQNAAVTVSSGATLAGNVEAISATDIRTSLAITLDGTIAAADGAALARAVADRSFVDALSADVGAHVVTINNTAIIDLAGDDVRSLVTMAVYGDYGTGSQTVTLNGAAISLDAGAYTGEVHGIDLMLNGDSAVAQSVMINDGSLAVTADAGTAAGIFRQGMHGVIGGEYLGDFDATLENGTIVTSAAGMSVGVGAIATRDATVTLGTGSAVRATSSGDDALGIYLGDVDGTASVNLADSAIEVDAFGRALGVNVFDAASADVVLDGVTIDVTSLAGMEAAGIHVEQVFGNASVLVTGGSIIRSAGPGFGVGIGLLDSMDVTGDSASVRLDGGSSIQSTGQYVTAGIGVQEIDAMTITVDAASIEVSGVDVTGRSPIPVSAVLMQGASESGTVNVLNAAQLVSTGDNATGIYAVDGGYLQVTLDGSTLTSSADMNATGVDVLGAIAGVISVNNSVVSATAGNEAHAIRTDAVGFVDIGVSGGNLSSEGLVSSQALAVANATAATVMLWDSGVAATSASGAGAGMVFSTVDSVDLALRNTAVTATGQGISGGVIADGFDVLGIALANGSSVAVDSAVDAKGIGLATGNQATVSLTGNSTITATGSSGTFYGISAEGMGQLAISLDGSTVDAGSTALNGETLNAAGAIRTDAVGLVDIGVTGSSLISSGLMSSQALSVTNATAARVTLQGSTVAASSTAAVSAGLVFNTVATIDLGLSNTALRVSGQGSSSAGVIADGFDLLGIALADASSIAIDSAVDADGIRILNGNLATISLAGNATVAATGPVATFWGITTESIGQLDVALDGSTIDAGNASLGSVALSGGGAAAMNVSLTNGSFLVSNGAASSYGVGVVTIGDASIAIDATSGIIDSASSGSTESEFTAAVLAFGNTTLSNAGLVNSRGNAIEALGNVFVNVINTGTIAGDDHAAFGSNIAIDNSGLISGRLDIASLNSHAGSELRALLDTTSPLLSAGDAYWKVSGAATLEDGTTIRVGVSPTLGAAIQANATGYDYLMLRAGTLTANTEAINLVVGPLLSAVFTPGLPTGEIGVSFQQVACADAGLTANGQSACEAAVADDPVEPGVSEDPAAEPVAVEDPVAEPVAVEDPVVEPVVAVDPVADSAAEPVAVVDQNDYAGNHIDLNGDPDTWGPIVSDMMREAPRLAATMVASSVRRRLLATFDGENSGDPMGMGSHTLWIDARATESEQDAAAGVAGFDAEGSTVTIGADGAFTDDLRLGLAVSMARASADETGTGNTVERDATIYSLYGKWESGALGVEAVLSLGTWNNDQLRFADTEQITAGYDSQQQGMNVLLRRKVAMPGWELQPQVAASYLRLAIDGYREQGDGTPFSSALAVGAQAYEEGEVGVGVQFNKEHAMASGNILKPSLDLMLWHDLIQDQTQVQSYFLTGSPVFVSQGSAAAENRLLTTLAVEYQGQSGLKVKLGGEITAKDGYIGKAVSLRVEYNY